MLKRLTKSALIAAGLVAGAQSASAAKLGSAQLTLAAAGEIVVIADDGQNYSRLESSGLTLSGNVRISMDTGTFHGFYVFHGICGAQLCGTPAFKTLYTDDTSGARSSVNTNISFGVSADQFPQGLTSNTEASRIFGACNDRMNPLTSRTDKTFTHYMRVTLGVAYAKADLFIELEFDSSASWSPNWWDDFGVPVTVRCKATRQEPQISYDHGIMRLRSIELELTSYSHSNHNPSPALTCRILHVTVRIETSRKGLVHFDLSRIIGNGGLQETDIALEAKHKNGRFIAEYYKTWKFSKTTHVQFRAKARGAPAAGVPGISTPWKSKTVECENAGGGGGYTQEIPPRDLPPGPKLTGDFTFIDNGGTRCPRGKALMSFKYDDPANVDYSLDCTNGSFSGVVKTAPHPNGGHMALALVDLGVKTSTLMSCDLKAVAPQKKLLASKAHFFQCVKPTGVSGATDFVPDTRPDPKAPAGPRIVIDPPRTPDPPKADAVIVPGSRITCIAGVIRSGACRCARSLKPVPTGTNAWRCTKVVVDPPPSGKGGATKATLTLDKKTGSANAARLKLDALKLPATSAKTTKAPAKARLKVKAAKKRAR